MYEYPDYTYTQSAAAYNEWIADKYPADERPDQAAHRGRPLGDRRRHVGRARPQHARRRIAGPLSCSSASATFKNLYGVDVRIGWNPDSFGYNWQLPQIYKRSGIDYFVTQKMTWNDTNQLPFKLFWWESPDGSKVLAYFPHDYANNNLDPVRLSADLATARERSPGMTEMMDLYGIGDHGGGPTRAVLDEGDHWSQPDKVIPKVQFGTRPALLHQRRKADRPRLAHLELRRRSPRAITSCPLRPPARWPSPPGKTSSTSNITAAS